MAYTYTPAFIAFCNGAPPEEISSEFGIPLKSLLAKIREEGWRGLANKLADRAAVSVTPSEKILAKIEQNRAENYGVADALRTELSRIITKLSAGTLKFKKVMKGEIVEVPPSPADLVNIATFARTIADLSYRALADSGTRDEPAGADAATTNPPGGVTVILPAVAVHPRFPPRELPSETVVDVQAGSAPSSSPLLTDRTALGAEALSDEMPAS
jgi:hypothetical protein